MASSFTTNYGFEEIVTGEQSGTWGTTTNFNFDILDRIASYKAVALSDASTATLTVREASPGEATENLQDGMFRVVKFTGSLAQNCTVTIAPNTTTAWFIFENATTDTGSSGPYSLLMKQGSGGGASVTIQNGKNAIVYCDGAGSGAVVTNALADLQISTLEVTGAAAVDAGITTSKEDSGTNTVLNPVIVKRTTTSGSPAAGIGAGIEFTVETSAANNEIGATVQAVTTDVSSTAEDFDIVFNLMESGATAAERARLTSAGVWTVDSIAAKTTNGNLSLAANGTGVILGNDTSLSRVNLLDYGEVTNAIGATGGGTQDIDLALGNNVVATVDTSTNTFTFTNPTASDELSGFTLFLTNGGSQTVVWPGTVDWAGGTAPTLTTAGLDILVFITTDGGSIWHGMVSSADSKSP
jgi:hypothetical protein